MYHGAIQKIKVASFFWNTVYSPFYIFGPVLSYKNVILYCKPFLVRFLVHCAANGKIPTDANRRAVPLQKAELYLSRWMHSLETLGLLYISRLLRPVRVVKYCDEYVCLSVCVSVCLSVYVSVCQHASLETVRPNSTIFLCMLPVAVARSFSDGVAICYVLPVLQMTSCFRTMGPKGGQTGTALCG